MTDLRDPVRDDLDAMFRRREGDVVGPPRMPASFRRRAHRRQAGTAALAVTGLAAVVALTVAGIQAFDGDDRFVPTPREDHTRPVFERTATIEGFTVTSPSDWFLVDRWAASQRLLKVFAAGERRTLPVLEVTNFDPGLERAACDVPAGSGNPLPPEGVAIFIALADDGPGWDGSEWCGGGDGGAITTGIGRRHLEEDDDGMPYVTWLIAGEDVPAETLASAQAIYDSIRVRADAQPLAFPGTDTAGYILWAGTDEDGSTWTIEARPTDVNVDLKLVTRETDGTYSEGGMGDFEVPPKDVEGDGSMGVVTEEAERVEFQPTDGSDPAVALLADLPPSLGYDADAYWFPESDPTETEPIDGELVAVMPVASPSVDPLTVPGGVVVDSAVIGEGTHPTAGDWEMEVSLIDPGGGLPLEPNLGFSFDDHGGSNGTLQPLEGAIFRGWGSGWTNEEDIPLELQGPVSKVATSVVFEPKGSDETIDAFLFPIPNRFIGQAQAFLVLIDASDRRVVKGELIAYGADGQELDRVTVGDDREPGGVTPEIDAVIQDIRAVRDALPSEPGFGALDLDTLAEEAGVDVTLGSDPTAGTVSIVVEDDQHVVLLAELPDGQILCIGAERAWSFRYGIGVATTYQGCAGGWDGYTLPPDA